MRVAITQIRVNGKWSVLLNQDVSIDEQKRVIKKINLDNGKSDFGLVEEIQMWTSSRGMEKRKKFKHATPRFSVKGSVVADNDDLASALAGITDEESPKKKSKK